MSLPELHSDIQAVGTRDVDTRTDLPVQRYLVSQSFGMTDKGMHRPANEDQFLIARLAKILEVQQTSLDNVKEHRSPDRSELFVVADGMGGHRGGQHASALAIATVEEFLLETFRWFARLRGKDEDTILNDFRSALGQANERVWSEAAHKSQYHGMGTTLTLAFRLNEKLFVAHAGDSRCYLLRKGLLYRLTTDHTLVEELVRQGQITPEQAASHRWRHVITNVIGGLENDLKVEVHKLHLEPGDVILLCSDGLTNMVDEDELAQVLASDVDPERMCQHLVQRANDEGGQDNITVIVGRFVEG